MNDQEQGIVKAWQQGLAAKDAEIARLRAALEMFADKESWSRTPHDRYMFGHYVLVPTTFDDAGEDQVHPAEFARKALEGTS